MLGVAAAAGARINFLNFVALPITFGIGVDYAANVWLRYRQSPHAGVEGALRTTGGAVLLNSLTTVIGYAALLIAHNRALRSFGELAILGEAGCATAALVALPAFTVLLNRARKPSRAAHPAATT
jgi:predicted RND superfamily exporter protein